MKKTRIIWISTYVPVSYASSGGSQTFNYYFKKMIQDELLDIRLISCGKYSEYNKVEEELKNIHHHVIYWNSPNKTYLKKLMNLESRFNPLNRNANLLSNSDELEILNTIKNYVHQGFVPDKIILEWTPMVMLAAKIKKICPNARIFASEHDVTYIGFERKKYYYKNIRRLIWKQKYKWEKKKEIKALKMCSLILPHNPENIDSLIEEGIDNNKLLWLVPYFNNMSKCMRKSNRKDILFFGAMSRPENYLSAKWFCDKVMPLIDDLNIRFIILGSNPPPEIKKYESDKIHVTGYVDSVYPFFEKSMCMVAPLVLGAGIKIKVLEALSSGIPVLTNDIGIEGINASNGEQFFYCKTPKEYEIVIRNILNNIIDEDKIMKNARAFIENSFSPEKFQIKYKDILRSDNI